MAIKYNGHDLQKRMYNGHEVQKAMYNGNQIWPESTPPVPADDYLCFTANTPNSTVALNKYGIPKEAEFEVSYDKINWMDYTIGDTLTLINQGRKVYFRNKSEVPVAISENHLNYYYFSMSGSISSSGDVDYLLCKHSTTILPGHYYTFTRLFRDCSSLTTAPKLPAVTLVGQCYVSMFSGCTSLISPPALPAVNLTEDCYMYMFSGCSSLTTTPLLPATKAERRCYAYMFHYCTSLTTAPALPATTLDGGCYREMFNGCTSLRTAPSLPATDLEQSCYAMMFYDCESLEELPSLPAATFLPHYCYERMFSGCSNIKISEEREGDYQTEYKIFGRSGFNDALSGMFDNTGGEFTGTPERNTTYYTSNTVV